MRSLQSQPPREQSLSTSKSSTPLPRRAEIFTKNVMSVLSPLIKPSIRSNLQINLLDVAKLAISVWNIAQTDEREIIVYPDLDPEILGGEPSDSVIVLFPRITAQSCSRITDTRPISIPGTFEAPEIELHIQKTCIYDGAGLLQSSPLVSQGEAEEYERKEKEEKTKIEKKRRMLDEEEKKLLQNQSISQRRRASQVSMTGSGSRPSEMLMNGGAQRISEGMDI